MPCFPMFCSSLCSMSMLRLHTHMLVRCYWLRVYVFFAMFHAQIYIHTCICAWICVLPCPCAKLLHVCMHISMPICPDLCFHMSVCSDLCFHMLMCLDLCSLHDLCACALHAMFVCLDLGYVLLQPVCCFIFLSCVFGLLVRTRSRLYDLCHRPYTSAHIKGFGSPLF